MELLYLSSRPFGGVFLKIRRSNKLVPVAYSQSHNAAWIQSLSRLQSFMDRRDSFNRVISCL